MNIRKANLNDLDAICDLNNQLFKLEKENYDPTLIENWPLSKEGREYFKAAQNAYNAYFKQIKNPTNEQRNEYLKEHLNLPNFLNMLDKDLMDEVVEFFKK